MKKLVALLCLAVLLAGAAACAKKPPDTPTTETTTAAEPISAQLEPMRVAGYDYYLDGKLLRNDDGTPMRAFDTDVATCRYIERDGGIYVTRTMLKTDDEDVVLALPAYVDGKPLLGNDYIGLKNVSCKELRLPDTMQEVSLETSTIGTLVIPKGLQTLEFDRTYYRDAVVDPENPYFSEIGGILASKDKTVLVWYPTLREDKSFKIPDGVTEIAAFAFSRAHNLEEIVIPPTVTRLADIDEAYSETLGFGTTIVTAPGSAAEAFVNKHAQELELKLVLQEF